MKTHSVAFAGAVSAVAVVGVAASAMGATIQWTGAGLTQAFDDHDNWDGRIVPGTGDTAAFQLDADYIVEFRHNAAAGGMFLADGHVRFRADRPFNLPVPSLSLHGPLRAAMGRLTLGDDGDLATTQDYMHLVVADLVTAQDGAELRFLNGSSLTADGLHLGVIDTIVGTRSGSLIVDGWDAADIAFSTLTIRGDAVLGRGGGSGSLRIANDARAAIDGAVLIDDSSASTGSTGSVDIFGGGSLTLGDLVVGTSGTATFSSMFRVRDEDSTAVQHDDASITLGSKSAVEGGLYVSHGGSFTSGGGLTLLNTSGFIRVGQSGQVVESTYNARGDITVQNGGRIEVADGGVMHLLVGRTLRADRADSLQLTGGILHVNGATITTPYINFSGNGRLNFNYGKLDFTQDLVLSSAYTQHLLGVSARIGNLQTLAVAGNTTLEAPLYLDGGTLSVGSLTNAWLLQFQRGTLELTKASLGVTTGGQFGDTLTLAAGQTLRVASEATVEGDGRLVMRGGRFAAGALGNFGEIQLDDPDSRLDIGNFKNLGVVRGEGIIASPTFSNFEEGDVRIGDGERLRIDGALSNVGQIDVIGGELDVTGLTNNGREHVNRPPVPTTYTPGSLFARDATLRFGGGLTNLAGTLGFSFGTSDVFGDVTNFTEGTISVSGGGNVTFYDDVINNGELRVSDGATAVYFGHVSGSGAFTGGGLNLFEGTFSPGSSPAISVFEGDFSLGQRGELVIELGGLIPGEEHDQLRVGGDLHLDGTLQILLLDGFTPTFGDVFHILDFDPARLTGVFAVQDLPGLGDGLWWDTDNLYTTGTIAVVPEPAAAGVMLLLACGLTRRGRRVG